MITEEQLKEWEDFLTHQTPGGVNYYQIAAQVAIALIPAYREQKKEIERLKQELLMREENIKKVYRSETHGTGLPSSLILKPTL